MNVLRPFRKRPIAASLVAALVSLAAAPSLAVEIKRVKHTQDEDYPWAASSRCRAEHRSGEWLTFVSVYGYRKKFKMSNNSVLMPRTTVRVDRRTHTTHRVVYSTDPSLGFEELYHAREWLTGFDRNVQGPGPEQQVAFLVNGKDNFSFNVIFDAGFRARPKGENALELALRIVTSDGFVVEPPGRWGMSSVYDSEGRALAERYAIWASAGVEGWGSITKRYGEVTFMLVELLDTGEIAELVAEATIPMAGFFEGLEWGSNKIGEMNAYKGDYCYRKRR